VAILPNLFENPISYARRLNDFRGKRSGFNFIKFLFSEHLEICIELLGLFWTLSIVLYVEDKIYHNVSETGSVSVLRWMGQDKPTQLGPLERASLNHWTMDRVQNKPNSSVQHTPSSESFQVYLEICFDFSFSITVLRILIYLRFYQSFYIRNCKALKLVTEYSPYFSYKSTFYFSILHLIS
jgi:hypothetical protein